MKYRPLKGADFYAKELYYGKGDGDRIKVFKAENVKSAVQGLLEEIEKLKSEITDEYKNECLDTAMKHYCFSLLNECKKLVKKWFADVVEGDECQSAEE